MGWDHSDIDTNIVNTVADHARQGFTLPYGQLLNFLYEQVGHNRINEYLLRKRLRKLRSVGLIRYQVKEPPGWLLNPMGNRFFRSALAHSIDVFPLPLWIEYPLNADGLQRITEWCEENGPPRQLWASGGAVVEAAAVLSRDAIRRGIEIDG